MHRSAKWYADRERELQRIVWPNGAPAPARSAAEKIYPNLRTDAEWRTVTVAPREPQSTQRSTVASRIYPNLK